MVPHLPGAGLRAAGAAARGPRRGAGLPAAGAPRPARRGRTEGHLLRARRGGASATAGASARSPPPATRWPAIPCHHLRANELSVAEFAAQARDSKALLEDLTGSPVRGFRAPEWSLREPGNPRLADARRPGLRVRQLAGAFPRRRAVSPTRGGPTGSPGRGRRAPPDRASAPHLGRAAAPAGRKLDRTAGRRRRGRTCGAPAARRGRPAGARRASLGAGAQAHPGRADRPRALGARAG